MEASLAIRKETDDKVAMGALYSNLAIVAEYEGDYERSCSLHEEGLAPSVSRPATPRGSRSRR